jgi:hypothetical protein
MLPISCSASAYLTGLIEAYPYSNPLCETKSLVTPVEDAIRPTSEDTDGLATLDNTFGFLLSCRFRRDKFCGYNEKGLCLCN